MDGLEHVTLIQTVRHRCAVTNTYRDGKGLAYTGHTHTHRNSHAMIVYFSIVTGSQGNFKKWCVR